MHAKYKKINKQKLVSSHFNRRICEGIFIIAAAVSIFLLLALITYNSSDPSWSRTGTTTIITNRGGFVGAWLADFLFCIFGFMAYIFPLMLAYAAWLPFQYSMQKEGVGYGLIILRIIGFILILTMGSGLAGIYLGGHYLPTGPGGIVGDVLSNNMIGVFNVFGAGLIMLAFLLTGITLFSGLAWMKVIDALGSVVILLFSFCYCMVSKIIKKLQKPTTEDIFTIKTKVEPKLADIVINSKPRVEESDARQEPKILSAPKFSSLPSLNLLNMPSNDTGNKYSHEQLQKTSNEVELCLKDFGVDVKVVAVHPGPVITRFELQPAAGTKANKITTIATDLARSLSVTSVRVVEVIPGKSVIGLELPNENREVVCLRETLASKQYRNAHSPLALALGKDIAGHPVVVDLAKMPHLLVAGTTGSGKSVGLNALILSLLYKYSPQDVRLILIDPKMLELSVYEGIPHLLTPVVTDMKDSASALRWCVAEMERRYKVMASLGVRNIIGYNNKVREAKKKGAPLLDSILNETEPEELKRLPYIVVVVDEFADMMMVVGKKIEELIARIAQKARAAGIHLILATQRPSVDVITGLIKANIPSRIGFQVSSRIDSRTILDQMGAEQLLGAGDMLYLPPGTVIPMRIHGAFVADDEVHKVVSFLQKQGQPEFVEEILTSNDNGDSIPGVDPIKLDDAEQDPLYDQAVEFIVSTKRISISSIQRRFKIGYNRAARMVEAMEIAGVVSEMGNNGGREVLIPPTPL